MEEQQNENQLNIELSEEIAEGIFSNLAIITHSNTEFVLDFIRIMPGVPKAKVKSRIILTPEHAKRLLHAFQDNIDIKTSPGSTVGGDKQRDSGHQVEDTLRGCMRPAATIVSRRNG